MDKKKFEDLKSYCQKEGFDHLVGWAIWDELDIEKVDIFDEQNIKVTLPKLHENTVLIGLNASESKKPSEGANKKERKTWAGFHNRHQGGRDSWLRELVKRHPELEGAYMTDVFKIPKSKSSELKEAVSNNEIRYKEYIKLEKELSLLGSNLTIVLIGDDAEKYFKMFEDEMGKVGTHRLFKIPHYASRITQEEFLVKSEKGLKKEITDHKYGTILGL